MTASAAVERRGLVVILGTGPRPDLPPDAQQLAGAFLQHALAAPPGPVSVPAARALRHAYLPAWTRSRYAAAMRTLIGAGVYRPTQHTDGRWTVRVDARRSDAVAYLLAHGSAAAANPPLTPGGVR